MEDYKPNSHRYKEEQKAVEKRAETAPAADNGEAVYHTIESGDTFGHLAVKYDTTSKKIEELNADLDPNNLQIGQKVRVK